MNTKWIAPVLLAPAVAAGVSEINKMGDSDRGSSLPGLFSHGLAKEIPEVLFGQGWIYVSFPGRGVFSLPEVMTEGTEGWTILQTFGGTLDGFAEIRAITNIPTESNGGIMLLMPTEEGCVGDINNDGTVDLFDLFEFLEAFANNDPLADLDGNGRIDFFDFVTFIEDLRIGC